MKTLSFTNGDSIPQLGLGTWKSSPGKVAEAVKTAVDIGYRHIDCAAIYGNEAEIGGAFAEAFAGGLPRNELFVTSKLWNDAHAPGDVQPAIEKTLNDLQLDYLDLYLMHWPVALHKGHGFPAKPEEFIDQAALPFTKTWEALEKVKDAGLAKHIGVSNFSIKNLSVLLRSCQYIPEMNQVEMHPYLPQKSLFDFCTDHNILMTAYSPLGSGDRPDSTKAADEPAMMENKKVQSIAQAHDVSPAQILLAWAVNRGTAVIPKSVNPGRLKENFASQDIGLTAEEMDILSNTLDHYRFISGHFWTPEGSPYTKEFLWGE